MNRLFLSNHHWRGVNMKIHAPGIYYDMPFDEYMSDPALSQSGIKNLLISDLTYWINSPMNPNRSEQDTDAKVRGKAWHKRILEGKEAFGREFCAKLRKRDFPGVLSSGAELKEQCEALGIPKSGTIAEMCARLRIAAPYLQLWDVIEAEHATRNAGKTEISPEDMEQIELAVKAIEASPDVREILQNGKPEVSLFWIDEETGLRMKARIDWLQDGLAADLKTFANQGGRQVEAAVGNAMHAHKHGIQAVVNLAGLKALQHAANRFTFIFYETGAVPNVLLRNFVQHDRISHQENAYWQVAHMQYRQGVRRYAENLMRFGTDPWLEPAQCHDFEDQDFPPYHFN